MKSGGRYSEGMRQGKEMKTEQGNKIPVYRRLADEIKAEILSGKRAPGSVRPPNA